MSTVFTGIDLLQEKTWQCLRGYRLGLLANQASLNIRLKSARQIVSELFPGQLRALYGPQHGFGGEEQDNMVETPHSIDPILKIPVFSLYSDTRQPLSHMLEMIDILLVDLQDVGTRVYTFPATMLSCLRVAAAHKKKVIVLDRPNPLGGELMEGNLLQPDLYSFVGVYRVPMRHGMTMGEMARMFNDVFDLGCDLEIVPLRGWVRKMHWEDTGRRWIMPSPNMPLPDTARVYPGQVIWEGTNLSEGRGTCRPFEIFGAPYLDSPAVKLALEPKARSGCILQEYSFRPTYHKWKDELCNGFMIHVVDAQLYRPYLTSLALLKAVMEVHPDQFEWRRPPYEYEYKKKPIDFIMGDSSIRQELESGCSLLSLEERWLSDLRFFNQWRKSYLLYP